MASVHLAQLKGERNFSKWVAVKVVHRQFAGDPKFEKMFLNEARLLARIDHPNVCTVFDFGEVRGTYYLAMEYLHGQTLQRLMRSALSQPGWLSYGCAARIIADAADGLHAAHELLGEDGSTANVVHRDVSPQNLIVLYSGVTKVLDFGIARSEDREDEMTSVDEIKGKLAYMAPEQLRRQELDRRTDVFSLGIVLWELSCGRRLFRRKNEGETVVALLQDPIPTPTSVVPDYPPKLEKIVMRALARDREERYQSTSEMARDLEQFIVDSGKPVGHSHVAEAMRGIFGREIDEHTSSLRRSADLLKQIQELTVPDLEVELEVGERVETSTKSDSLPSAVVAPVTSPKSVPVKVVVAMAALLLAGVAGAWLYAGRTSSPPSSQPAPVVASPPPVAVAPTPPPSQAPPAPAPPTAVAPATTAPVAANPVESNSGAAKSAVLQRPVATKRGAVPVGNKKALPPAPPVIAAPVKMASPVPVKAPTTQNAARENDEERKSAAPRPMTSFE